MKNLSSRGKLSVEDMNDLFEGRLRVNLPGGSFKVVQRSYSGPRGSQVFDHELRVSTVIFLQPEGHILPLNPVPARSESSLGKTIQAN
jgi:hypothetical protein